MDIIKNAHILYVDKQYKEALALYSEAKNKYNFQWLDFNIELCKNKIEGNNKNIYRNKISHKKKSTKLNIPRILDKQYSVGIIKNNSNKIHKELVSIIIPSYNNASFLKNAIHSALSQEGVNVEVIVVDDGSVDNSIEIASEISKKYKNLKIISLLRNFGCYYARNIGVMNTTGEYVTTLDSDDIIPPHSILTLINTLKSEPNAVAVKGMYRRYSANYTHILSGLKNGECSLLWKKNIINIIGYYDTVRYGGDTEFRSRIQHSFGIKTVIIIKEELYFARTIQNSLTLFENSRCFIVSNNKLESQISPQRKRYRNFFEIWQKKNIPDEITQRGRLYINFPLFKRKFNLGKEDQNASPSLNQKVIGILESFPERIQLLELVVKDILSQLDELNIYLNDYEEIPSFLKNEKIKITLGKNGSGDLRDNGKFYKLPSDNNSYIFTFDDEIEYPVDYVAKMIHNIEMFNRKCIVCANGLIFPKHFLSYYKRDTFHFKRKFDGEFVDLFGSGTTAWHSSLINIDVITFTHTDICDLEITSVT